MIWSDSIRKTQKKALKARLEQSAAKALKPPPKLSVSAWADRYRQLSSESSSEAGRWSTSRAEYQRGMMDAVSDPEIENVVLMTGAQIGKTELINNVVGFHIHQDPAPMLVVQPTLEMAQTWSKDRLSPAIRDTPALSDKIKNPRSRDSGNTTLHKVFPGGHVTACGANSPSSLASRPCRVILCDEVDRYPLSAGSEGDPVGLAKRRANTFWNRKIILVSTPTEKGASRIEQAYEESDKRKYYVPCPDCSIAGLAGAMRRGFRQFGMVSGVQLLLETAKRQVFTFLACIRLGRLLRMLRETFWRQNATQCDSKHG